MSKITDHVEQNTPRLVVEFSYAEDGKENFKWGMIGSMPAMTLLGYINRVQESLLCGTKNPCDAKALVIAHDEKAKRFRWWCHLDIPIDALVGMLETIKHQLIYRLLAPSSKQQGGIVAAEEKDLKGINQGTRINLR